MTRTVECPVATSRGRVFVHRKSRKVQILLSLSGRAAGRPTAPVRRCGRHRPSGGRRPGRRSASVQGGRPSRGPRGTGRDGLSWCLRHTPAGVVWPASRSRITFALNSAVNVRRARRGMEDTPKGSEVVYPAGLTSGAHFTSPVPSRRLWVVGRDAQAHRAGRPFPR